MHIAQPPPGSSNTPLFPQRNESATMTYTRILLGEHNGYPLWRPEPYHYPPAYAEEGIRIGDVGIVNEHGIFEFCFNVCLSADHPINSAFSLPNTFEPFIYSPHSVELRTDVFRSNTVIASSLFHQELIYMQAQHAEHLCQFKLHCSAPEGAVLVLPNGAVRTDFLASFRRLLFQHARQHALSWLEWVYGLNFAGDIYLITGTDKCDSWCLASYSSIPTERSISLSFTPMIPSTFHPGDIVPYTAQSSGNITQRTFCPNEHPRRNQTTFIRGFKISPCRERLRRRSVKIQGPTPQHFTSSDSFPGAAFLDWILSQFTNFFGNGGEDQDIDTFGSETIHIQRIPGSPEVHHPSDIINAYMLRADPNALFAITHDDEWCSVIEQDEDAIPDGRELLQRVLRTYHPVQDAGCVMLVRNDASDSRLVPLQH